MLDTKNSSMVETHDKRTQIPQSQPLGGMLRKLWDSDEMWHEQEPCICLLSHLALGIICFGSEWALPWPTRAQCPEIVMYVLLGLTFFNCKVMIIIAHITQELLGKATFTLYVEVLCNLHGVTLKLVSVSFLVFSNLVNDKITFTELLMPKFLDSFFVFFLSHTSLPIQQETNSWFSLQKISQIRLLSPSLLPPLSRDAHHLSPEFMPCLPTGLPAFILVL